MIRWEKYFGCNLLSEQFFWGFPSEPIIREVIMHATERQFSLGEIDQGGIVQVEIIFGAIIRGTIIWGQQFVGNYPGGNLHGGLFSGEAIFWGATIMASNPTPTQVEWHFWNQLTEISTWPLCQCFFTSKKPEFNQACFL